MLLSVWLGRGLDQGYDEFELGQDLVRNGELDCVCRSWGRAGSTWCSFTPTSYFLLDPLQLLSLSHFPPLFIASYWMVRNPYQIPLVIGISSGAESRACSPCHYLTGPRRQRQPPAGNNTHTWFLQWPGSAGWEVTALTSGLPYSGRASWSTCLSRGWSEPVSCSLDPGTPPLFFVERRCRAESDHTVATLAEALPGLKATLSRKLSFIIH